MFQMRYLERKKKYIRPFNSVISEQHNGIECTRTITTLQYRYCEPCAYGMDGHDGFTEWTD